MGTLRLIPLVLLVTACAGETTRTGPTPLETECVEHVDCYAACPEGVDCDRQFTCGFQVRPGVGYCTIRCDTEAHRTMCLEWGGQCSDPGIGAEWCRR